MVKTYCIPAFLLVEANSAEDALEVVDSSDHVPTIIDERLDPFEFDPDATEIHSVLDRNENIEIRYDVPLPGCVRLKAEGNKGNLYVTLQIDEDGYPVADIDFDGNNGVFWQVLPDGDPTLQELMPQGNQLCVTVEPHRPNQHRDLLIRFRHYVQACIDNDEKPIHPLSFDEWYERIFKGKEDT